ncbi:hypothetical protein TSMEX_011328, partial [Taenia solium]
MTVSGAESREWLLFRGLLVPRVLVPAGQLCRLPHHGVSSSTSPTAYLPACL